MSDQNPRTAGGTPPPPAYVDFNAAVIAVAGHLGVAREKAYAMLLDALCDGALTAMGNRGGANFVDISPQNWVMHKYENSGLFYSHIELGTIDLLSWLSPEFKQAAERNAAQAKDAPQTDGQADSGDAPSAPPPAIYRTGLPGQPSAKNLWEAEARRRFDAGEFGAGVGKFAESLSEWVRETYPGAPKCGPKALENSIRALYRERVKEAKHTP